MVYRHSWERWTYYLRKVLDSLKILEEKATELGLSWRFDHDPSCGAFSDIRALSEVLTMDREEGVVFAAPRITVLYRKWKEEGLFQMKMSEHFREPLGLFSFIEFRVQKKLDISLPFYQWISEILSIHTHSRALIRLIPLQSFKIIQGTVNIEIIAPSSLLANPPPPIVSLNTVKPAVLHTRLAQGGLTTMELYRWSDPIYDDAAHEFAEWATEKLQTSKSCEPHHPHYEVQALNYIHEHSLNVYPYIASLQLSCSTCKVLIDNYYWAQGIKPLGMSSARRMDDTCPIPQFEGELGERFRRTFLEKMRWRVAWTAIRWISQLPVPNDYWQRRTLSFQSQLAVNSSPLKHPISAIVNSKQLSAGGSVEDKSIQETVDTVSLL
ncbi:hypothetical protein AAF712_011717 [Marasmius tenuissimus]|uniref:Uncharacterized protein n=1 Tax=Marasmius tenuissimus TaxID=585030 RepID=A0ABR2ZKL1_9AGAR